MRQIERNAAMNEEEKAVKYGQEFKRLKKLANEVERHPVNVRLENAEEVAELIPSPNVPFKQKTGHRLAKKPPKSNNDVGKEDEDWQDASGSLDSPPPSPKLRSAVEPTQNFTMIKHGVMQYIREHGSALGINAEGKILRSLSENQPYKTSNIEDVVNYLLNKDKKSQYKNFPVGYKEFVERAQSHALLKKYLLTEGVQTGSGPSSSSFSGFNMHKKQPQQQHIFKFKPTIWY
jgi:hypothetical protein